MLENTFKRAAETANRTKTTRKFKKTTVNSELEANKNRKIETNEAARTLALQC